MTKDEIIRRGQQAERLLTDPLIVDAFAELEAQLLSEWRDSGPDDVKRREDAWRTLKLLDRLKKNFESFVRDAKVDKRIAKLQSNPFRGGI